MVYEAGLGVVYNLAVLAVARATRTRMVLHHHTSAHSKRFDPRFQMLKWLAGDQCVHVTLGAEMAADIRRLYGNTIDMRSCGNSFLLDRERPQCLVRPAGQVFRLGMMANLTKEKGSLDAIASLRSLLASGVNAQLVLAGPICDAETREAIFAAEREFPGRFETPGQISGEKKAQFFSRLDLFILPSRYRLEAQPLVIIEALSHGAPTLSTNAGYISELLPDEWRASESNGFVALVTSFGLEYIRSAAFRHDSRVKASNLYREHSHRTSQELDELLALLIA